MNVNDVGVQFLFGCSFNLSSNTSLSLVFTRPDGTTLTVTNPAVTISSSPVTTPVGTFAGNQYAIYTFAVGDVSVAGLWSVRLIYQAMGVKLISDVTNFTVGP